MDLQQLKREESVKRQPQHLEMAEQVANDLIHNFNGSEQWAFIDELKSRIQGSYNRKIEELEIELKSIHCQRSEFNGEK